MTRRRRDQRVKEPTPPWQWILVATILGILLALAGCSYEIVIVKNVGPGCSSVLAGQASNDVDADATGTAGGGRGDLATRLARAIATDDRCPEAANEGP